LPGRLVSRRKKRLRILSFAAVVPLALVVGFSTSAIGSSVSPLMCANPGSTTATANDTTIHANSCTDFSYSSPSNQSTPANNWLYGFYQGTAETLDPAGFNVMTQQLPQGQFGWWAVDFYHLWTSLDAFGGHPNSTNTDLHDPPYCDAVLGNCGTGHDTNPAHAQDFMEQWAVRRYIVPIGFNGMVSITLSVQKDYRTTGPDADGATNLIILYSGGVATTIASINTPSNPNALTSQADANTFAVQTVTMVLNVQGGDILDFPITPNANDYSDGEFQLITIQAIPEPSTMLLVAAGLLAAGFARRKYSRPL
jgi:hypothetical protein